MKALTWLLVCALLAGNQSFTAAKESDGWLEGVVVLKSHEVLLGEVKIHGNLNALQLRQNGRISVLPSNAVLLVNMHDPSIHAIRTIITIDIGSAYSVAQFFEVIIQGEVNLVAPFAEYQLLSSYGDTGTLQKDGSSMDIDLYYFDGKTLIHSRKFRQCIYPAFMSIFKDELTEFIRAERIRLYDPTDQIKLLNHFNRLHSAGKLLVRN